MDLLSLRERLYQPRLRPLLRKTGKIADRSIKHTRLDHRGKHHRVTRVYHRVHHRYHHRLRSRLLGTVGPKICRRLRYRRCHCRKPACLLRRLAPLYLSPTLIVTAAFVKLSGLPRRLIVTMMRDFRNPLRDPRRPQSITAGIIQSGCIRLNQPTRVHQPTRLDQPQQLRRARWVRLGPKLKKLLSM